MPLWENSQIKNNLPVGTILAWDKNISPNLVLPGEWVECNGQTINDPESPLYGKTIPNLNGENRFLRGNNASGSTGGSETHSHSLSLNGTKDYDAGYNADNAPLAKVAGSYVGSASSLPPYYDVVYIMRIK